MVNTAQSHRRLAIRKIGKQEIRPGESLRDRDRKKAFPGI